MKYTVIGATGFIGREFVKQLKEQDLEVLQPKRGDETIFNKKLGHVIYAAGYGNCTKNPINVLSANCTYLCELLQKGDFDSLTYLSSTRVYLGSSNTSENTEILTSLNDSRRLFNLTKLVSEELLLLSNKRCLIIRPSNVYGLALDSELFLPSIIRDALNKQQVNMYVTPDYAKDYVFIGDVVRCTLSLIKKEEKGIFNIAAGMNTSAKEIAATLKKATGCSINWHVDEDKDIFHPIDVSKLSAKIEYVPKRVLKDLEDMIRDYSISINKES